MSMRKSFVFTLLVGCVALLSAATQPVFAGSGSCSGASCQAPGLSVPLDINVVIPSMMRLQIGAAAGPDVIDFNPSAAVLGDGTPVPGTGGNLGGNEMTFRLLTNGATSVDITAATSGGGLVCQAGGSCAAGSDKITWASITVAKGTAGFSCLVDPPQLNDAGSGVATYSLGGSVIDEDCSWAYTFANNLQVLDGTYSGTVTYTAVANP